MIFSRYPGRYPLFFQVSPGRFRLALEMTLASLGAIWVGETFHLPLVDLYPIILLILWKDNRVLNVAIGSALLIIFAIIVFSALFWVKIGADNNSLKFLIELFLAFLFFFLTVGSKLGILLGPICGLALTYGLVEISRIPSGEVISEGLLYLLEATYIASGSMILFGLLLGRSPQETLSVEIAWRLRVAADLLTGEHRGEGVWKESNTLLVGGAVPLLKNVKLASLEKLWTKEVLNRSRQAALSAFACLALAQMAAVKMGRKALSESGNAHKLAAKMREMAAIFERRDLALCDNLEMDKLSGAEHPALNEIAEQLQVFSEKSLIPFPKPPKTGFILPGALKSAENYRFATKGALTVGLCICLYLALDWQKIHTCVITCFIIGLPTVGEMVTKQTARISGTLVGAVFVFGTLIFVMPHLSNIAQFLLLMAVGLGSAAWLKSGPEKFSYAGFQIGVVIALSELSKNGPGFDLTTPRDRIIGILVGIVLTYVIFTRLWPVSAATRLPPLFEKCFTALEKQYQSEERVMRLFWASAAQDAISEAEKFLIDAKREPPNVRLPAEQLKKIKKALHQAKKQMRLLLLPRTEAREAAIQRQKEALRQSFEAADLIHIAGKTPTTKQFAENPTPT